MSVSATNKQDPRWAQAEQVREEGKEIHGQAQEHLDNALSAGRECKIFEAMREAGEAAESLKGANDKYTEANHLESDAAIETVRRSREERKSKHKSDERCIIC